VGEGAGAEDPRGQCRWRRVVCCAMRNVEPEVFLVARPSVDYEALAGYLHEVGGDRWIERLDRDQLNDAENLAEFAGKMCYRS
jgi:thymidylate synthase (FAD)